MKIAVIGAGSAQFIDKLADFCSLDGIGPYEVALVDTNATRLDVAAGVGRAVSAATGVPATITTCVDRVEAVGRSRRGGRLDRRRHAAVDQTRLRDPRQLRHPPDRRRHARDRRHHADPANGPRTCATSPARSPNKRDRRCC